MPRLAINGYGRIGRCVLRALYERGLDGDLPVVAINEPASLDGMAHLTRFDSTHGVFPGSVAAADGALWINDRPIAVTHESDPSGLDWEQYPVDLVLECSGSVSRRSGAEAHLAAGAPRVLISHPMAGASDVDLTVVLGVNHEDLAAEQRLVSNASCSTNCLLPVLQQIHRRYGIEAASVTTIHSVMNDQPLVDGYHDADLRRTRSGLTSMVPVATGLARGIERFMPEMSGRLHAQHVRVPTLNVSAMDVSFQLREPATAEAINSLLAGACERELAGILGYSEEAHASCDFNHDPRSGIVDGTQTRVSGQLAHLMLWFDNEWGFANRMVDIAARWLARAA